MTRYKVSGSPIKQRKFLFIGFRYKSFHHLISDFIHRKNSVRIHQTEGISTKRHDEFIGMIITSRNRALHMPFLCRSYDGTLRIAIQMISKGRNFIFLEIRRIEIDVLLISKSEECFRFRSDRILGCLFRHRESYFGILARLEYLIEIGPNQIGIALRIVDSLMYEIHIETSICSFLIQIDSEIVSYERGRILGMNA